MTLMISIGIAFFMVVTQQHFIQGSTGNGAWVLR
jgi:hypothetical protein